jgi:quinol-cytochrome oxidoreductase complex cytochrome b subunit
MEARVAGRSKRQMPDGVYKQLFKLTIGGGVAFWGTTFVTSLLPIAAEYRAAFSISHARMVLVDSWVGGLIFGCCVSYFLLRLVHKHPTRNAILTSTLLGVVALVIAEIMVGGAASFLPPNDALHYFLIGALLNVPRFLILGLVIGYLYKRLYGSA